MDAGVNTPVGGPEHRPGRTAAPRWGRRGLGINYLDLKTDGLVVIDVPPNSLGFIDDFWFGFVADLGLTGPTGARAAGT